MSTATTHIETEKRSAERSRSKLVPALRFNEFEGDIKESFFGNHYTFHITNSLSRDKLNYDKGEVRNIHYGDIHTKFQTHFYLTKEYVPFINENEDLAKIKEDSYCKIGDLVIADASEDYADIGKSIELIDINNEKLLAGLHTFLARPSSESTAVGYISYLLKSWKLRKQIMTIAQGTKVLSLSTGRVSKLKLNLSTLPEQQKIASFLSAVDEKIQQLTKKKALLEQYKKGVMQQLFSGQLRFKDENGNAYPDWEKKRVDEILTPYSEPVNVEGETMYQQIGIRSHGKGIFHKEFISGKSLGNKRVFWIKENLFVVNIVFAWEHAVSMTTKNEVGMIASHRFPMYQPKHNLSHIPFIVKFFLTTKGKYLLQLASPGGAGRNKTLGKQNFNELEIKTPSLEEQQKIATYLSSIDTKIERVTNQITQTQTFKKGLLQQMFV